MESIEGVHKRIEAGEEHSSSQEELAPNNPSLLRRRAFELFRAPRPLTQDEAPMLLRARSESSLPSVSDIGPGSRGFALARRESAVITREAELTTSMPDEVLLSSSDEDDIAEKGKKVASPVKRSSTVLLSKTTAGGARARRANYVKLRLKSRSQGGTKRRPAKLPPPRTIADTPTPDMEAIAAPSGASFMLPDAADFVPLPQVPLAPPTPRASLSVLSSISTSDILAALKQFGHNSFRPGQREAIDRLIRGQSTLLVTPTGSGKSLTYQLPSLLYSIHAKTPALTLVVSPLLALMADQMRAMPACLPSYVPCVSVSVCVC